MSNADPLSEHWVSGFQHHESRWETTWNIPFVGAMLDDS
jgi:hypothetical protein